jgi:hypothetical protein
VVYGTNQAYAPTRYLHGQLEPAAPVLLKRLTFTNATNNKTTPRTAHQKTNNRSSSLQPEINKWQPNQADTNQNRTTLRYPFLTEFLLDLERSWKQGAGADVHYGAVVSTVSRLVYCGLQAFKPNPELDKHPFRDPSFKLPR